MPNPNGNPNLHGNKNSGRKSTREEFAKNQAIKKAWEKVNNELDDKGVEKVALPIALKDMRDKSDITTGGQSINKVLVEFIDGKDKDNTDTD